MMKFSINENVEARKLKAVMVGSGNQFWFYNHMHKLKYFNGNHCNDSSATSLDQILAEESSRRPVYEGESITIQF